jgi:hypothetical protein
MKTCAKAERPRCQKQICRCPKKAISGAVPFLVQYLRDLRSPAPRMQILQVGIRCRARQGLAQVST